MDKEAPSVQVAAAAVASASASASVPEFILHALNQLMSLKADVSDAYATTQASLTERFANDDNKDNGKDIDTSVKQVSTYLDAFKQKLADISATLSAAYSAHQTQAKARKPSEEELHPEEKKEEEEEAEETSAVTNNNNNNNNNNKEDADEGIDEKPKVGFIKCVDINKLLSKNLNINKEDENKEDASSGHVDLDNTVITLSSSESETECSKKQSKSKKARKPVNVDDDNDDDEDVNLLTRKRNLRKRISTRQTTHATTRKTRRNIKPSIKLSSTSSSSTSSSSSSSASSTSSSSPSPPTTDHDGSDEDGSNKGRLASAAYDYESDPKWHRRCMVSLAREPIEQIRQQYLAQVQHNLFERLTDMNSLKRSRQRKSSSPSSSSLPDELSTPPSHSKEKRSKLTADADAGECNSPKSNADAEEQGDNGLPATAEENAESDGYDHLAATLSAEDEHSDHSQKANESGVDSSAICATNDEEPDDNHVDNGVEDVNKQNKPVENSADVNENDKNSKGDDNNDDDDDDDDDDVVVVSKKTNKWRKDKLLNGKLNESDSEDELLRFRKKDNHNNINDTETSKTKKSLKRFVRRRFNSNSSSDSNNSDKEEENTNLSNSGSETKTNTTKPVRKRIKRMNESDSESEANSDDNTNKPDKKEAEKDDNDTSTTRKKIRNVLNSKSLADATKQAAKEEEERKKRIAERQKVYNEMYLNASDDILDVRVEKVVLDFDEKTKEELLSVHPVLAAKLKPHQAQGVRFMWTACFESLARARKTDGSGCILAHCMGLGKTLQVIALIHTLLTNGDRTRVRTALVVCPLSTVLNWVSEFHKWLDDVDTDQVNVFDLVAFKQNPDRLYQLQNWTKRGGVMVMGYDMFRNLSNPKGKRLPKKLATGFNKCLLDPGPDLVICDEGHLLKNEKTSISIAMNRLPTKRRIVLTGTPLQNNLKEYFCMVQFVKPSLLGTYREYLNRFVNPITNGQYTDSTQHDIYVMRKRAHVLHKMLDAIVERRDYNVLAPFLPPKNEYVLFLTLSPVQCALYQEYLDKFARNTSVKGTSYLFQDFQAFQRICIHPRVLLDKSIQDRLRKERDEDDSESEGSLKDFINDEDESSADNSSSSGSKSGEAPVAVSKRRTRANPGSDNDENGAGVESQVPDEWWSKFCDGDQLDNVCSSTKLLLLLEILHKCEQIGDKVLVFSQSLFSLNLIEYFLARIDETTQEVPSSKEKPELLGGYRSSWTLGLDYFRMDGSTACETRAAWCRTFNDERNTRARLFLISTRAGGLGINLVAANRVIIFDVSWNPSHDIQSIYRVYRFGQTKPCYIYRFVMFGAMENKIYERQVTKQAISKRVIDEQQIDRHYNQNDLTELYAFNPVPEEERPIPLVPKDRLFADLLQSFDKQIFKYHEHNSLLENKVDEGLNEEERRAAWEEFENEKKAPTFNLMQTMVRNGMYETLRLIVQQDNAAWTPAQVNGSLPIFVQRMNEQLARGEFTMYRRVEERHQARVLDQKRMQLLYQQYVQQMKKNGSMGPLTFNDVNKFNQILNAMGNSASTLGAGTSTATPPTVTEIVELND